MSSDIVKVIGLMSGTSLDGLDVVYVLFDKNDYQNFNIVHSETIKYSKEWEQRLGSGITCNELELIELENEYTGLLSDLIIDFIAKNDIKSIDFIASHGHTIFHKPDEGYTLQIGNGQTISKKTRQKVVCDFRTQDVALGGQGAPLVPIGDELLFSKYEACLNLGGFANISFKEKGERIAFDICPVNLVLNHYAKKLGKSYDDKGTIARSGILNVSLLEKLNTLDYYYKDYPKSLGLEWVQEYILPIIEKEEQNISIILRTVVEHVAIQIANSLENKVDVLVTGGGVYNEFLLERLKMRCTSEIIIPNDQLINFKEALIFAFLGLLRVDNQVNCLRSVTGAKRNHSSGEIFTSK